MEKNSPEETKTNVFLDNDPNDLNNQEQENEDETYASLEEYFLDCCREGLPSLIMFFLTSKSRLKKIGILLNSTIAY